MHYGFNFFSFDPKEPIIIKLMPGGKQMGQREGFSSLDLRKINRFYNCTNYVGEYPLDKWTKYVTEFEIVRTNILHLHRPTIVWLFTIFTESIPAPQREIIKIVSGKKGVSDYNHI